MTERYNWIMKNREFFDLCCYLSLLIAIILRLYNITADPPYFMFTGAAWGDTGGYIESARNAYLFGIWNYDFWNPIAFIPVQTVLLYIYYNIVGFNIHTVFYFNVFLGTFSIFLVYRTIRSHFSGLTVALITLLLSTNYLLIFNDRVGTTETLVVFTEVLIFYTLVKSFKNSRYSYPLGFLIVIAFLVKTYLLIFSIFTVVYLIFLYLIDSKRYKKLIRPSICGGIFGLITVSVWMHYYFYEWYYYIFELYGSRMGLTSFIFRGVGIFHNANIYEFLNILIIFFLLYIIKQFSSFDLKQIFTNFASKPIELYLLFWIASAYIMPIVSGIGTRHLLSGIFPIVALSAIYIQNTVSTKHIDKNMIKNKFVTLINTLVICYGSVFMLLIVMRHHFHLPINKIYFLFTLIIVVILSIYIAYTKTHIDLTKLLHNKYILFFLLSIVLLTNIVPYVAWAATPTYNFSSISGFTAENIPEDEIIYSYVAAEYCFADTHHKLFNFYSVGYTNPSFYDKYAPDINYFVCEGTNPDKDAIYISVNNTLSEGETIEKIFEVQIDDPAYKAESVYRVNRHSQNKIMDKIKYD